MARNEGAKWQISVFHTSGLCCTEEPTVGQNVLVAKCTCGTKMAWRENCAQSDKCVHNLYGQHCCDSSTICDLQQMCHLFPPTNSLLFSALMVRAQYLFTRQDKLQVATELCLVWPQQSCHQQQQHSCRSEMLRQGNLIT